MFTRPSLKKRRSDKNRPPIVHIVLLVVVLGVLSLSRWLRQAYSVSQNRTTAHSRAFGALQWTTDTSFLQLWQGYVQRHPVQAKDRMGFAEMGLRTQIYLNLLEHSSGWSDAQINAVEQATWSFMPGIQTLRRRHLERSTYSKSKGIVMTAGKKNWLFALHLISSIRTVHRSTLPIELFYYGENDLPSAQRNFIQQSASNIRLIDLSTTDVLDHQHTQLEGQGYALKPFALLLSTFDEVLLLDADAVLLQKPETFFDVQGYKSTGTLFFHDREHKRAGAGKIIHDFLHDQFSNTSPSQVLEQSLFWQEKGIYQQESGLVVVDKSRKGVFASLLFTAWQNIGDIREETTYRIFWGDKESFWLAFELAKVPYYFQDTWAGAIGVEQAGQLCSEHPLHMLSVNPEKKSVPAWFNGSLLSDKRKPNGTFLTPTAWAIDGTWHFSPESEDWCLRNFLGRSVSDFHLSNLVHRLSTVAESIEQKAKAAVPEEPSTKQYFAN